MIRILKLQAHKSQMDNSIELQWQNLNLCIETKEFNWWKCQRKREKKVILNNGKYEIHFIGARRVRNHHF